MFPIIRKWALAALLSAGLSPVLSSAGSANAAPTAAAESGYKVNQTVLIKEAGKPDRRCIVASVKKHPDGMTTYVIKRLDNGETITIHDRVPSAANRAPAKHQETKPSAMGGVSLPSDASRIPELPVNPPAPEMPKLPTAKTVNAKRPESSKPSRSLADRIFGKSEPNSSRSSCNTCATPKASPLPGQAVVSTKEPPVARLPLDPVPIGPRMSLPIARTSIDPLPITPGADLPFLSPTPRAGYTEPRPLPIYEAPIDPVRQAGIEQQTKHVDLKQTLKNAERPSYRMAAAEELAERGRTPEIRAALMIAAQDDPAGCVRATCVRCLAKHGGRDHALMTLLIAAQSDKDAAVREEAAYALEKLNRK